MGKRRKKPPQPTRESEFIDTQALANELYRQGLITKLQAHGGWSWIENRNYSR